MKKITPSNARDKKWGVDRVGRRTKPSDHGQMSFAEVFTWGGPRKGAGRKKSTRARVEHTSRPGASRHCPMHVTLRRAKGLPSLRSERIASELRRAVRATRRDDFRIAHYSVQDDHVHMIVEADDARALANGMKSFTIRAARRLNGRVLRRRGTVWGDRYHRRDLSCPSDVRNCLVYVLNNHMKHHHWEAGVVDECSSAPWFQGWMQKLAARAEPSPVEAARSWLLEKGWHDGIRFIHLGELPRALCEWQRSRG